MTPKVGDLLTAKKSIQFLCDAGKSYFISKKVLRTDGTYYLELDNLVDPPQQIQDYELGLFEWTTVKEQAHEISEVIKWLDKSSKGCTCGAGSVGSTMHSNWCDR